MAIPATTDEPIPNIKPMPVTTIYSGAMMLTAAMPSAPTPWPTKMPSITVSSALNSNPSKVGKNIFPNKGTMRPLA